MGEVSICLTMVGIDGRHTRDHLKSLTVKGPQRNAPTHGGFNRFGIGFTIFKAHPASLEMSHHSRQVQ
jgi:hypothetical protein